jgi:hypothetical protein
VNLNTLWGYGLDLADLLCPVDGCINVIMKYQSQKIEETFLYTSILIELLTIGIIFYKVFVFIKIIIILGIYS